MAIIWDEDETVFRIEANCDFACFELRPCMDPFCGCLTGHLLFFNSVDDDDEIGFPVKVDLESKSCVVDLIDEGEEFEDPAVYEYLRNFIASKFDDSDWSLLKSKFIEEKQAYVEDFDVKESYLYRLPYEVFDQDGPEKIIKYRDVFPLYEQFEFTFDNTLYKIDEYYRIIKDGERNLVNLKLTSNEGQILNCEYNFVKDRILSSDFDFGDKLIYKLKEITIYSEEFFKLRELKLKLISVDIELSIKESIVALAASEGLLDKVLPIVNSQKIGRNDPCPCGSGKKYKKCCMLN